MTHQCTVCLKHFDFVSKLRRHQLTHSGQRPFTCYICLKSFRQSAHLKGHLKSHSKLRKVSLIVSRTIHSQIPFTGAEGGHERHAGAELRDERLWYGSLQTNSERGFGKQDHGLNEENRGKLQISDDEQMCEFVQGSYDGLEHLPYEESFQNSQYSECATILPNSATMGSCVEQQEHREAIYVAEDTQKTGSCREEQTAQASGRHQCSVCLKCFSAPSKLKRHVLIHSSLRPFCCEFCPKAFRQLTHLKVHLSTHLSPSLKQVKEVIFVNAGSQNPQSPPLDTTNTPENQSKPSERLWTEEAGELVKELNGSENIHTEPFPEHVKRVKGLNTAEDPTRSKIMHECPVCRKCFSAPSKLRRHCLIHTGQRPFQCSLCCRAFRQLSHLKAHHSVHSAPRKTPSPHPQPGTSRTSKARLKRFVHISLARKFKSVKKKLKISSAPLSLSPAAKIINNKNISEADVIRSSPDQEISCRQDYSCSVCLKHFSAPSKLRRHLLIHTGQQPFRCSLCFRGFRQKSHLQVHKCKGRSREMLQSISEVHLRDPASSRSTVNIRQGDEVGKENFISICGIGDSSSAGHVPDSVPENSKDLASLPYKAISRHLDEANQAKESGYQCSICLKIFDFPSKLSRHLLIHMNIKPFKCSICSKSFRQLCHLQSHSKIHMGGKSLFCQGTYRSEMETFISETTETFSETNNCSKESEKLPVAERPDLPCDHQNMNPVNTSSLSCSMNIEEVTPLLEVHKSEESSSQMKRNTNQCIFCLKTFDFPSKLSRHLLVHTGIRPYKCHVCYKSFKQLSHLQCHQWVHNRKDQSELEASMSLISSDGTSLTDDLDLHQESLESLAMINQGHDFVDHQQKWISEDNNCCFSDSGQSESKVKSESDISVDESHDLDLLGSDSTSSAVFYKCLDQQTEQSENKDYKHCLNITGEVLPSAADGTIRIPVWNSADQQESFETRDPAPLAQKTERRNQHLTEPPNDLPICPSCSQCFDSLQKLKTHNCPVHCSKQRLSKSYQCAVCFKSFEAPSKLKRHYVIHTGQRPYRCNMCEKDFTQSSHLKTHMMSHR